MMGNSKAVLKIISLSALFILVSCSGKQGSKVKLESRLFGLSGNQRALFVGVDLKTDKKFSKLVPTDGSDMILNLPNGEWGFGVIAWDGAQPLEGNVKCFSTARELSGGEVLIDASVTTAGCNFEIFAGTDVFDSSSGLKTSTIHGCSSTDHLSDGVSDCEGLKRGFHRSFRISLMQYDETLNQGMNVALESRCIDLSGLTASTSTNLRLPDLSQSDLFKVGVKAYENSNCSGSPKTTLIDSPSNSPDLFARSSGTAMNFFFRTDGPLKMVELASAPGTACDYGNQFEPRNLNTNPGGGPYLFRGLANGSGESPLLMSEDLSELSATRVIPETENPVGEETVRDSVFLGGKLYFTAKTENSFTHNLFSFDASNGLVELSPTHVPGVDFSNQSGVMPGLVAFGTKIYFSFKDDPYGVKKLCQHNTLDGSSTCSIHDPLYSEVKPLYATASGVVYLAIEDADPGILKIRSFDGTTHALEFNLNGLQTSIWNSMVITLLGKSYLRTDGSPMSKLFYLNDLDVQDVLSDMSASPPLSLGSQAVFVSDGMPMFVDGTTTVTMDSLTGSPLDTGGGTLTTQLIGVIGDHLYLSSNRGTSTTNLLVFNRQSNALVQLTFEPSAFSWTTAILNNDFYFLPSNSSTNTALHKVTGSTVSVVKVINPGPTYPSGLKAINGRLYISIDDGVHGTEPWVSDGTTDGTQLLRDTNPGSASAYANFLGNLGNYVFFTANGRFYRTRGTPSSTQIQYHIPGLEIMGSSNLRWEDRFMLNSQSYLANKKTLFYITQDP